MPTSFSDTKKYEVIARNESDNEWRFREQHRTFIGTLFCLLDAMKYDNVSIFIKHSKNKNAVKNGF